jgi:hypothetical protein
MACTKEKVPKILKDLRTVVHDMEEYLEDVRKKQEV